MAYVLLDRHKPRLVPGLYTITAELTAGDASCTRTTDFVVGGERFAFPPALVHSVYPPEGSRDDYSGCLPHVALRRDTLPWERPTDGTDGPWLALVVLSPDQCKLTTISLGQYRQRLRTRQEPEVGEADTDTVQVIELDSGVAARVIPTRAERALLCHVRGEVRAEEVVDSVAVVVSAHRPQPGRNVAHLVSLEGRVGLPVPLTDADDDARCTFVSLMRWSFVSGDAEDGESLPQLLRRLKLGWLRVPAEDRLAAAEPWLSRGTVPLPHHFRTGESGASWYAGPLAPGPRDAALQLPARSADALLAYEPDIGMFDVTYSAAWELGRLLVLQRRDVEVALSTWRRERAIARRVAEAAKTADHLPQVRRALAREVAIPPVLIDWVRSLWKLDGVPFRYLVPDETMLPTESLRFFLVDPRWLDALLDGALSLTRSARDRTAPLVDLRPGASPPLASVVPDEERDAEGGLRAAASCPEVLSGFLLRSAIVSGWPDLEVEAEGATLHHRVSLSPSIELFLFAGRLTRLRLRQHDGTLHLKVNGPLSPSYSSSSELAQALLADAEGIEVTVAW